RVVEPPAVVVARADGHPVDGRAGKRDGRVRVGVVVRGALPEEDRALDRAGEAGDDDRARPLPAHAASPEDGQVGAPDGGEEGEVVRAEAGRRKRDEGDNGEAEETSHGWLSLP